MGIKVEKSRSLKIGEESYNDVLCIRLIKWRIAQNAIVFRDMYLQCSVFRCAE